MKQFYSKLFSFSLLLLLLIGSKANAQFSTATVNGSIAGGEYGTHTDGQNQNTNGAFSTLMTWDNTNLYVAISGSGNNTGEGIVLYLDKDNLTPIDSGTNTNGTNVGNNYDGSSFTQLPFRADLVVYLKDGYNEYRTPNGSNGWNAQTSNTLSYTSGGGTVQEFSIPWSLIGGRPTSFNFFSYKTSSGGFVYAQQPTSNAGGTIGTSARYSYYYTVTSTADTAATKPFSRMSYVFNSTSAITGFGSIGVWDFTMNSGGGGTSLTRTTGAGGAWTISGNLVVGSGTVDFGSSTNSATVNNVNIAGGTLTLSTAGGGDLNVAGNFSKTSGTFNCNARQVDFNGTGAQTYSSNAAETINFLKVSNTSAGGVALNSSINLPTSGNSATFNASTKTTIGAAATLTLGSGTTMTANGASSTITVNGKINNAGTITSTATVLTFGATGTYEHNFTTAAGAIPTATWSAGSTCAIIGYTSNTTAPTGLGQTFSNFLWNTASSSAIVNLAGGLTTVNGNLTFQSTNAKEVRLAVLASYTLAVGGDFSISSTSVVTGHYSNGAGTFAAIINVAGSFTNAGTLRVAHSSNVNVNYPSTVTINVTQNVSLTGTVVLSTSNGAGTINQNGAAPTYGFSQTAGSIDFGQGTLASSPGVGAINVTGTFARTGTGLINTSGSQAPNGKITFKGGASQTLNNTTSGLSQYVDYQINNGSTVTLLSALAINTTASTTSVFTVLNGGTLVTDTNIVSGAATTSTFALNAGATLKVGSVDSNGAITTGAFGNIQTTTRTLDVGATYEYNGASAQFTGNGLPASLTGNVKINNSAGVTLSQNTAFTGAGTLTLTSGKLTTNTKTLTLISSTTGSASSYVVVDATGTVTMNAVTTAKTLPIGTSTSYAPLTLAVGSSTAYTAYVRSTTGITCGISNTSKALNLAWVLTAGTVPTSATFQWNPATDQGASFTANGACELGRIATPATACPYTVTAIGTAANTTPNTVAATTGFATGTNTYVIGNTNAISLAAPTVATTNAITGISHNTATSGGTTLTGNSISAKGVVYSLSTTTTTPTLGTSGVNNDGVVTDGATTTADFTS